LVINFIDENNLTKFANPAAGMNNKHLEAEKISTSPLTYFNNNVGAFLGFKVHNIFLDMHFHIFNGFANPPAGMNNKHLEAEKMSTGPLTYFNNNVGAFFGFKVYNNFLYMTHFHNCNSVVPVPLREPTIVIGARGIL
jgi:hypothetical protein